MSLNSDATLEQIISTLEGLTGVNQESELRSSIRNQGINNVGDLDTIPQMISKLNNASIRPVVCLDNIPLNPNYLWYNYCKKNYVVNNDGTYYFYDVTYDLAYKVFKKLMDRNNNLIRQEEITFISTTNPANSFVYVTDNKFYIAHANGGWKISEYDAVTMALIKTVPVATYIVEGWGSGSGFGNGQKLVFDMTSDIILAVDTVTTTYLNVYDLSGNLIRKFTNVSPYSATPLTNNIIGMIDNNNSLKFLYMIDGSISTSYDPRRAGHALMNLIKKSILKLF